MTKQPTKRPLDYWFNKLRSSTELSEYQVQMIIASHTPRRRSAIALLILNRRFIMFTVLLMSLVSGSLFIASLDGESTASRPQSLSGITASSPRVASVQKQPEVEKLPKVVVSGPAAKPLVRKLSEPSPKPTITEPPHILQRQGIMALELTTEELAKIGIQMLPDGGMRLYAGRPNVNFFRKDSHVVETHTATYTITADSGIEDRIPRQFSPAGIDWIAHSPITFYTENNQLHLFRRVPNEAYDRHVNVRRPRKTAAEEAADRHFWDSVEYSRFVEPMIMRWAVPVNIKIQNGQRTISLWLSVRRIAPYLPDRYRIPIEAEIKRLTEIDEQQAKELSSKNQTIIAYDISRAPDEPEEDTNAYALQQHRLMEQARPGDPVMEVWWQSAGAVMVLNVTPNPARDVAEVSFLLEAPRMVALDLYRYDGQRVKRVAEGISLPAGQHQLRADLHGIQPGLYLLGITTDRSEQALRRVYVTQ